MATENDHYYCHCHEPTTYLSVHDLCMIPLDSILVRPAETLSYTLDVIMEDPDRLSRIQGRNTRDGVD